MATETPADHHAEEHHVHWHQRSDVRPAYAHSFWWFMFANGGAFAAIFLGILILVLGILGPLGVPEWMYDRGHFAWTLQNPIVKLFLLVLCGLTFIHAAHRTRYLLMDLGVLTMKRPIQYLMYGLAGLGTVVAAFLLFTTP
jgi:fumarate reductase subunit D